MKRLILLFGLLAVVVFASPAVAVIIYSVGAPHDSGSARSAARDLVDDYEKSSQLLHWMEWFAVADVSKPPRDIFGNIDIKSSRFDSRNRADIERHWGPPIKFVEDEYARPISGNDFDQPIDGLKIDDLRPENDRVKFYAFKDLGGVQVIYNKDGIALKAVVIYLKVDKNFVPLKSDADLRARLNWELPRLRRLNDTLGVPSKEAVNASRERAKQVGKQPGENE